MRTAALSTPRPQIRGKTAYVPVLEFTDKPTRDAFSARVIAALIANTHALSMISKNRPLHDSHRSSDGGVHSQHSGGGWHPCLGRPDDELVMLAHSNCRVTSAWNSNARSKQTKKFSSNVSNWRPGNETDPIPSTDQRERLPAHTLSRQNSGAR
jgi:hypothetical protein